MAFKPAFAQGAQIEHNKYGLGSVASCTEEYIVIKFDDHGEKKFVLIHRAARFEKERPAAAGGKAPRRPQKSHSRSGAIEYLSLNNLRGEPGTCLVPAYLLAI